MSTMIVRSSVVVVYVGTVSLVIAACASRPLHVCVIGAGISGSVVAHYLSDLNPQPYITVFEKSSQVGGRIQFIHGCSDGEPVEAGASIIANNNLLLRSFVQLLGLQRRTKPRLNETSATLGLWDARTNEFILETSTNKLVSMFRMLFRYGLSLLQSKRFVNMLFTQFNKLYPSSGNLSSISSWKASLTPQALLQRVDLFNLTQQSLNDLDHGMSDRFVNEMIAAITRVNYGQDPHDMHALVGAVALAGSAHDLWSVDGGNVQVVSGLLKRSRATLRLSTRVDSVRRSTQPPQAYSLHVSSSSTTSSVEDKQVEEVLCDAVVLAAPAELANISLPHDIADIVDVGRSFQQTVATFVKGHVRANVFKANEDNPENHGPNLPPSILSISGDDFTSLGKQCDYPSIWKIFTRQVINQTDVDRLFEKGAVVLDQFPWLAYPKFRIPERFAPFDCDEVQHAFFYTSPLESAGSAMEMSSLAAANVAALIRDRFELSADQDNTYLKSEL